jgi:uncharacterized protein involved in tolerance to divalent cations
MIAEKVEHESKNIVFIYTTCQSIDEARSIGLSVIDEKLAISADYWPIGSIYPWHGVIQDVEQYMLMLTTQKFLSEKLIKSVGAMHSYSTPMITRLDTALINPTYTFWADSTLHEREAYITEEEKQKRDEYEEEDGYHYGKLK